MNKDYIKKIETVILTALGVGLAAGLDYIATAIKAHFGV